MSDNDELSKEGAGEALELISDGLDEMSETISTSANSEALVDQVSTVKESVSLAISSIGLRDIRHLNKDQPPLLEQINSFLKDAGNHARENGLNMTFIFKMITKNCDKLTSLLEKPWNLALESVNNSDGGARAQGDNVGEASAGPSLKPTDGSYTFNLATPLKEPKPNYSCTEENCSYSVSNFRVFKSHMKVKHGKGVTAEAPKVRCLLPHQRGTRANDRHPMDYICTHLKTVHGISKPSPRHELRGFESRDDRKTWDPVFLLPGEPDPVSAQFISASASAAALKDSTKKLFEDDNVSETENQQSKNTEARGSPPNKNIEAGGADLNQDSDVDMAVQNNNPVSAQFVSASVAAITDTAKKLFKDDNVPETDNQQSQNTEVNMDMVVQDNNPPVESVEENTSEVAWSISKPIVEPEKEKNPSLAPEKVQNSSLELKDTRSVAAFEDVEDELCSSYEGHLNEVKDVDYLKLDPDEDSDAESGDDEDFTLFRIRNKEDRFQRRNNPEIPSPADLPKNRMFIESFTKYLIQHADTENEKASTFSSTTALLFRHPDSWLLYQLKRRPSFSLDNLTCFKDVENFVELRDPDGWIDEIAGKTGKDNSIRRKEMYKCYKRLIKYLLKLLGNEDFGSDIVSILRRTKIKDNLKEIHEEIDACKTWNKLQNIIEKDHHEIEKARDTVNPQEKHNAAVANKSYFLSKEFNERMKKNHQIWKDALDTNKIGQRDFDTLGQFARHILAMTDRNRAAGYFFRNSDFSSRKEIWFPEGHNEVKFDGVPKDWDMFTQPKDGRSPDGWTMDLSGREEIVKLGVDVHIYIIKLANDWLQKYRDVKPIMWNDVDPSEYFFVNSKRKRFGPLINTSQLKEYAEVTNITKATTTVFRKGIETTVQSNEAMKLRSRDVASHDHRTGSKYYDPSKAQFRASAMQYINDEEVNIETNTEVPDVIEAKRMKMDQDGKKAHLEKAKLKLKKDPAKRHATLGRNCKVRPADRVFMQIAFSDGGVFKEFNLFQRKFPGEVAFKKTLYRIIDGYDTNEDVQRMRQIEADTFGVIKKESKEFGGNWEGTIKENKRADHLVAVAIRNSFRFYEKNKKKFDDSYFKF